jgi:hypothetical protein
MLLLWYFVLKLHTFVISFACHNHFFTSLFIDSLFARSLFAHFLFIVSFFFVLFLCLFVAKFKIKSKENNKNVCLTRIKINNIHWCHVFKIYFVYSIWNDKMSLFFVIIYFRRFKLFFRNNSTRIAKSRRDLLVIRLISRFSNIKSRMKKLALRNHKNESISFKMKFFFSRSVKIFHYSRDDKCMQNIIVIEKRFCIKQ